ncbi:hypothetical protein [Deinococcus soli (ex Cha et al. 2016)]|uniref:Uncharacterized protein n=2 Tax=Deinococcus soli (ex Cha et al. 2016) TaxID=1309411 RepID=A0AAE3XDI5_9DEIO|nr:hypothetical protein [Deinococcus soli (ex Cha et al. 2016)]MDR6218507.1 hypothetical protein [Deinococcus soli (ex Cha et al. 2016)]MDR6329247.1 hypothetical protein [Deinococcus soli (ex Cha et al. 2016)]MDR6751520.1 hypothetical protein [Deinococcus soli (ex Cha et al. 2016)]
MRRTSNLQLFPTQAPEALLDTAISNIIIGERRAARPLIVHVLATLPPEHGFRQRLEDALRLLDSDVGYDDENRILVELEEMRYVMHSHHAI